MARRPRLFAPALLYHVIVRGNQRQKTFLNDQDYQAYIERLAKYRRKYGYSVYAYCLMPNHVHLLLESSDQPLAKFMQGLQQSYSLARLFERMQSDEQVARNVERLARIVES
ncbi:MAG: transposase [Deltaproteobacteria bacterium]|nr:transposase [Deltaproteobacteria bacterium]